MSAPDARLNAAERAALAHLEQAASAADPRLAEVLGGRTGRRLRRRPALAPPVYRAWRAVLGSGWWGAALSAVGLLLIVVGLAVSLAVSLAGVASTTLGLAVLAEMGRHLPHPRR